MAEKPLLLDGRFSPFFFTQFLGALNDNYFKTALGILVVYSKHTVFGVAPEQFVALTSAVFMLPYFLFSATGGLLSDKLAKHRYVRVIKIAEILIMSLACIGFLTAQYELLLVVLFLMGTQSALFGPVKYAILPQLVSKKKLVGGNALVEMGTYLAILTGTIIGGLLIMKDGGVEFVASTLVVLAVLGWLTSRRIGECPAQNPDLKLTLDPVMPTLRVLKLTASTRIIFLTILGITWFWCLGIALLSLFPSYTEGVLGADEMVATYFLALFSIGIATGSVLCERLSKHRLELGIVPIGAVGMSLFSADLWWIGIPWESSADVHIGLVEFLSRFAGWRITFDLFLLAVFGGIFIVPLYTILQQRTSPDNRSQVIAGNNIVNALFMVLISVGLIIAQGMGFNEPSLFLILSALNAITAFIVFWQLPEFLIRFVVWILSNVLYRVQVTGHEHLPNRGPCLIAANHVSFIDWFILAGAIRRPIHFVMDVDFAKLPLLNAFTRMEWVIPIASRKRDDLAYEQAMVSVRRKLREGRVVGIFPEGMLTSDGQLNTFKQGMEVILERDPVPVVPVALNGLWGSWFSRKDGAAMSKTPRRFWSRVHVTIGTPIAPEDATASATQGAVASLKATHPATP